MTLKHDNTVFEIAGEEAAKGPALLSLQEDKQHTPQAVSRIWHNDMSNLIHKFHKTNLRTHY